MRVVLVAPEIPDYALEYAQVLSETCDVVLFIPDKFRKAGSSHHPRLEIRWTRWPRQRSPGNLWFMLKLSREIRRWRPDVVHCLDANYVWFNLLVPLLRPLPFVTTIHDVVVHPGDGSSQRVPRVSVKALVKQSTAIVVHGETLRSDAAAELPIDLARIFVFPHPPLSRYSELARQARFSKPDDNLFRILFFGRIHEYKGLRYLIEAAPAVRQKVPNARFVIAGKGDDFSSYRRMMADSSCFEIHNRFISEGDAARMFTDADLLVLPYTEASQSGVLLIALTFSLPVVATDVGEIGQIVRSTGMGFIVPPCDQAALASAIVEAATNAKDMEVCRQTMQRLMHGDFSRDSLSERALRMYESIPRSEHSIPDQPISDNSD
jgi:glycosyltransferase involved in cell wall biosynthesis